MRKSYCHGPVKRLIDFLNLETDRERDCQSQVGLSGSRCQDRV